MTQTTNPKLMVAPSPTYNSPGKPHGAGLVITNVRMTHEQRAALKRIAALDGNPMQAHFRRAITDYIRAMHAKYPELRKQDAKTSAE
jgi:hypothetical protein